jgi:hypothetical protein
MNIKTAIYLTPLAALVAACGTAQVHPAAATQKLAPRAGGGAHAAPVSQKQSATHKQSHNAQTQSGGCSTSQLSMKLGTVGHAAGSAYQPLVFTNAGSSSCTLTGFPGVSYVAPSTGKQVGAAASRNTRQTAKTVTLAPGGQASAMVQFVDYQVFPPKDCSATAVSGLRVYPPGETSAGYVAFGSTRNACSSDADQLTIQAVVAGSSGE